MKRRLLLPWIVLLAACRGGEPVGEIRYFDLAGVPSEVASPVALRAVDVEAPSWLEVNSMQYRLAYSDAARRQSYADSRWVASPRELIEVALNRSLAAGGAGGCLLRVELDEFIQQFSAADRSAGIVELRAALLAGRAERMVVRQAFRAEVPAQQADARGGALALSEATARLLGEMIGWMTGLDREAGAGLNIAQVCRAE